MSDDRKDGGSPPKPSLWKSFLCWSFGCKPEPITDFMTPAEIREELRRTGGRIMRWSKCSRCGHER